MCKRYLLYQVIYLNWELISGDLFVQNANLYLAFDSNISLTFFYQRRM